MHETAGEQKKSTGLSSEWLESYLTISPATCRMRNPSYESHTMECRAVWIPQDSAHCRPIHLALYFKKLLNWPSFRPKSDCRSTEHRTPSTERPRASPFDASHPLNNHDISQFYIIIIGPHVYSTLASAQVVCQRILANASWRRISIERIDSDCPANAI